MNKQLLSLILFLTVPCTLIPVKKTKYTVNIELKTKTSLKAKHRSQTSKSLKTDASTARLYKLSPYFLDKLFENEITPKSDVAIADFIEQDPGLINYRDTNGHTPLHKAIHQNRVELAQFLVEQEADINMQDSQGFTALHIAAKKNYIHCASLLVHKGADLNIRSFEAKATPLHVAIRNGSHDVAQFLQTVGADLTLEDKYGLTPQDWEEILK